MRRWPLTLSRPLLWIAAAMLAAQWGGAITVPAAKRPPTMRKKSLDLLPHSFAGGIWDDEVDVELAPLDMATILAQDAAALDGQEKKRRIGVVRALPRRAGVAGASAVAGRWQSMADGGRVWRLTVRAPEAVGMRLHITEIVLPTGCELLAFETADPAVARGPYGAGSLGGRQEMWTGAIFSDTVTLECYVPPEVDIEAVSLRIGQLAHIYTSPAAIDCHNDVSCYADWLDLAQGVVGIGAFHGMDYIFCSGCLLNDMDPSTWIDYLLTANHCVASQNEADSTEFYWFFQTAACNGPPPSIAQAVVTGGGADYLAGASFRKGADFSLLRLRSPSPDGATFNGWTTDTPGFSETLACIHHPEGEHKRISFAQLDSYDRDFLYVDFFSGVTAPGSSGGPLFDSYGSVIGHLYGGFSSCSEGGGIDAFGRFSSFYPQLAPWLARTSDTLMPSANPPFGSYPGFVHALRAGTHEVRGTATVTASKTGRLSAKVILRHKTINFKRTTWTGVTPGGYHTATLTAKSGERLELLADWDFMFGTLSGGALGAETLAVDLSYDLFKDRNDLNAQADLLRVRGYYTVALPALEVYPLGSAMVWPEGSGYLGVTISGNGSVKMAGRLADGTKVSRSARLLLLGDYGAPVSVPLYQPLYRKEGAVGGLLVIDPLDLALWGHEDNDWALWWDKSGAKPDTFAVRLTPFGGYYDKNAPLATSYRLAAQTSEVPFYQSGAAVALPQDAFPAWVAATVSGRRLTLAKGVKPKPVDGVYDYSHENSSMAKLSFVASSGLYRGGFNIYYDFIERARPMHKSVKARFYGILTQRFDTFTFGNDWPDGQGSYVVQDNAPELKALRLKRSFWIDLYEAP